MAKGTITIVMEGGIVTAVLGIPGIRVITVDYDVCDDGAKPIAQNDGSMALAYIGELVTERNPVIEESAAAALESE